MDYQGRTSGADNRGSMVVVEILERQDGVSDDEAATFFFDDLMEANGGKKVSIDYKSVWVKEEGSGGISINTTNPLVPRMSAHATVCSCVGIQAVDTKEDRSNGHRDSTLQDNGGDNFRGRNEISATVRVELCVIRLKQVQTDLLVTLTVPIDVCQPEIGVHGNTQLFREILSSFVVLDYSLFV